jgi:hypothetical protein
MINICIAMPCCFTSHYIISLVNGSDLNIVTFMGEYRRNIELEIGFSDHLYNSLLHFTNYYRTEISVLSLLQSPPVVSW